MVWVSTKLLEVRRSLLDFNIPELLEVFLLISEILLSLVNFIQIHVIKKWGLDFWKGFLNWERVIKNACQIIGHRFCEVSLHELVLLLNVILVGIVEASIISTDCAVWTQIRRSKLLMSLCLSYRILGVEATYSLSFRFV